MKRSKTPQYFFSRAASASLLPSRCLISFRKKTLNPRKDRKNTLLRHFKAERRNSHRFMFDHRSFIVKHEHNKSVCTKQLLQITWLPPCGLAQQLGSWQMSRWGEAGFHWPSCLQAELCPPPVSPLGVVPEIYSNKNEQRGKVKVMWFKSKQTKKTLIFWGITMFL